MSNKAEYASFSSSWACARRAQCGVSMEWLSPMGSTYSLAFLASTPLSPFPMRPRRKLHSLWFAFSTLLIGFDCGLHSQENEEVAYRFPREQRDIELREVAEGFRFGIQTGVSAYRKHQNDTVEKAETFEALDAEFLYEMNERLSTQLLVNYEFDGTRRVYFEELIA